MNITQLECLIVPVGIQHAMRISHIAVRGLPHSRSSFTLSHKGYDFRKKNIQVFKEECARLREGVPYVKVYRYNPKHLCPKLNGYGDKGARKVWSSCGSTYCTWFA